MSTTAEEQRRLKDRVHFTGRHDDVDPSPGPESCADTDCMVLRRLIADLEAAVRERDEAVALKERSDEEFWLAIDGANALLGFHEDMERERDEALGGIIRMGRIKDEAVALLREAIVIEGNARNLPPNSPLGRRITAYLQSKEPQHDTD